MDKLNSSEEDDLSDLQVSETVSDNQKQGRNFSCLGTCGSFGTAGSISGTLGTAGSIGTFGCSVGVTKKYRENLE